MPSFKLSGVKAQEAKSGFEPYDGPAPTRKGFYRGVIKSIKHGLNANSGSQGFSIVLELEAAKGDPKGQALFDGYPMFSRSIITSAKDDVALKEGAMRNLENFLASLGVKDEPDVVLAKGDEDKVEVLKIGGKNPVGTVVNVDVDFELYEGERRPQVGGIFKYNEPGAAAKGTFVADDEDEDEDDLMEDAEVDEIDDEDELTIREAELNEMGIPALKKVAKELEIGVSGTKAALVERILDAEFAEPEDAEDDADADADADSDADSSADSDADAEEDDEEEDDEEEDDDEAEEEDDEARAERVAELAELGRPALKSILKEIAPEFTILKRHSEEDLRDQIVIVEFSDDLPF